MGKQRRLAVHRRTREWRSEVTHQVGHRADQLAIGRATLVAGAVHPGTAALVGTGIEVEEEATDMLAMLVDLKQAYIRVPAVEARQFFDLNAVELLNDGEQAAQHLVDREPGAHLLLRNAVALLAQLLAVVADVPALQVAQALLGGEGLQLLQITGRERLAAHRQITQKI